MANQDADHFSSPEIARKNAREALAPKVPVETGVRKSRPLKTVSRYALPAIAFGVAMLSFAWPLLTDTDVSFTLSQDQVTESDGRVLMQNLRYTGVDNRDQLFVVNAAQGEQEDPAAKRVRLTTIDAQIDLKDQSNLFLEAREGFYRIEEEELSLAGDVMLQSDGGLMLQMAGAEVKLAEKTAIGQGNIRGRSQLGTLSAQIMTVDLNASKGVFEGRVKLKITPKRTTPVQRPETETVSESSDQGSNS